MIMLIELTRQRRRWELDGSCHPLGVSWWGGDLWTSHHPFLAPHTSWFLPWKPHVCWNSFSIALSGIRRVLEGADVAQTKRDMELKSSSSQPRRAEPEAAMPGQISAKRSFMVVPLDACRAHGHLPSDCFGCPMCHRAGSRTGCGARWEGKSEICAFGGLFLIISHLVGAGAEKSSNTFGEMLPRPPSRSFIPRAAPMCTQP